MKQKRIYIDFETYSGADIRLGPRAYTSHPDFRPVSLAYAAGSGRVRVMQYKTEPPPDDVIEIESGEFTAHNAPFDAAVWRRTVADDFTKLHGIKIGDWRDTAALCRYLSVPASLDGAAAFFGLGRKMPQGKGLIKKLTKGLPLTREETKELHAYNKQDVELLRALDRLLPDEMDPFTEQVHALHLAMNTHGIAVDMTRAKHLLAVIMKEKEKVTFDSIRVFGTYGKDEKALASSADQVKKYLAAAGFPCPSVAEKELEDWLGENGKKLPKKCRALIDAFREIQSRGADKAAKITANNLTRIYDSSIFHGAHTGRPTGGGVNLLNVKRYGQGDDERPFEKALARIKREAVPGQRVKRMSSLLWGCLVPDKKGQVIVRSDLSAIEPRIGAWLRRDERVLDIYRNADAGTGKDEYTLFGESMNFDKEILRPLSKIVILASCYGQSVDTFRAQCRGYGVPDPGPVRGKAILEGYHARNPSVKRTWYGMLHAAVRSIRDAGHIKDNSGLEFFVAKTGGILFLRVRLPSGRIKSYAGVRLEDTAKGYKTFSYIDPLRNFRQTMYGSMLYENMVQAAAVDVSFHKALEIQSFAPVKLIVHDEINVCTSRGKTARIKKIMNAPVPWLPGMPVSSKTVVCSSFHKGDVI